MPCTVTTRNLWLDTPTGKDEHRGIPDHDTMAIGGMGQAR